MGAPAGEKIGKVQTAFRLLRSAFCLPLCPGGDIRGGVTSSGFCKCLPIKEFNGFHHAVSPDLRVDLRLAGSRLVAQGGAHVVDTHPGIDQLLTTGVAGRYSRQIKDKQATVSTSTGEGLGRPRGP